MNGRCLPGMERSSAGGAVQNSKLVHAAKRNSAGRWTWLKYLLVTCCVLAFDVGLFVLVPTVPGMPVLLWLLLPVVVASYFGGFGLGLLATIAGIWSYEVYSPIKLQTPLFFERWASYVLIAVVIALLSELLHRARRKIEASELARSITLSSITDAVITTDIDGRVSFVNAAAEKMSGWSAEAALGREFSEVFAVSSSQAVSQRNLAIEPLAGDTVRFYDDCYLRTRSGALLPVEASAAPIRVGGAALGVVLTLRDFTERRKAEEAMRERMALQERLSSIAVMLPGALHAMRIRPDGGMALEYASPSFAEVRGFDPALLKEDAGRMLASIHPDDRMVVRQHIQERLRQMQPIHVEYRVQHPLKGMIWLELYAVPSREPSGGVLLYGILFDVTQRKRVEEQLRASQLQLRAALDAGDMGILQIDLASGGIELDESARKLWGLSAQGAAIETLETLLHAIWVDDREHFEREYRDAVAKQQGFRTEFRVQRNGVQWLAFHGRIDHTEQARRLMGLVHDISFRKDTEELRLRSQKLEALGVLAGGIAHDFNNLLLAIGGNVKLAALDLPADHPAQTSLREASKAGARATALVRQILTFSQPQNHRREFVELDAVLEEVITLVRRLIPETITLSTTIEGEIPSVAADSGQAHQALLNLLTNAADAVDAGTGRIDVHMEPVAIENESASGAADLKPGRYVRVMVADDGSGMDAVTLQRIFDPFFTTKQKGRGTGLGLAIVHGIMKGNDGAIRVDSTPGKGSVFALYFPAADGQLAHQPVAAPPQPARPARILYVDDEEPLVFLMTRSLQRSLHQVEGFTDPREALDAFRSRPDDFDLVVSDMAMPGLSGFEFASAVLKIRPGTPVVITSGYLRPEDHELAKQLGIVELVLKPNTVEELTQIVARCVGVVKTPG